MKRQFNGFLIILAFTLNSCNQKNESCEECKENASGLSCKLTDPELQQRKATVIASLKKEVLEKKELPEGYAYRFNGSDKMIDELTEFIKTERACCDFFSFRMMIKGNDAWLELTGPDGVKDFVEEELNL